MATILRNIIVLFATYSIVSAGVSWIPIISGGLKLVGKIIGNNKPDPPGLQCYPVYPYDNTIPMGKSTATVQTFATKQRGSINPLPPTIREYGEGNQYVIYQASNDGIQESCACNFRVSLVTCQYPLHPYRGRITCSNHQIQWGDTCYIQCDPGYVVNGDTTYTCRGDGIFSPSNFATCEKKSCPAPPIGDNMSVKCLAGHYYESWCTYTCDAGYNFQDTSMMLIQCQADQTWSGGAPECKDADPPVFDSCPLSMFLYPERLSEYAIATWEAPTATDPQDGQVPVEQITGPLPGSQIPVEIPTTITYAAQDSQGNQAMPCTFEIIVRARTCPAYPFTHRLNVTCYDQLLWGSRCELECDRGYPLHGPDTVYCEEDADQILFWNWGQIQPYCEVVPCHDLSVPRNGALSCSGWTHGRHCQMMCNILYDIPRTAPTTGEWVCNDIDGSWSPSTNPPDCSVLRRPGDMNLPSDLFYFTGDCSSEDTQNEIRENYIKHLNQSNYKALCIEYPECSVDNVEVICGPADPKKKSSFGFLAHITFSFIIKLHYPEDFTSNDYNTFLTSVDNQFYAMTDQFREDVSNGIMDLDVPGLDTQIDADSLAFGQSDMICDTGMVPRFQTFSCASCPTGTKFSSEMNDCELCPVGEYQDEDGQLVCKMCPDMSSTLDTGSTNITHCLDLCDYGHYSDTGMVSCAPCPVGTYMDNVGALNCTVCPDGKTTLSAGSNTQGLCMYEWELGNLDVCNSSICNGGYCVKNRTNIICICNGGYKGEFCELSPDPCRINDCQNGATCEADGLDDYLCICPEDFVGVQCEDQVINGGPSSWGAWSDCSVTCGNGEKTRERTCDNPRPGPSGSPCDDNGRQTATCNMGPCPECSPLNFPDRYVHQCTQIDGNTHCDVGCEAGYIFASDIHPNVSCGMLTHFEWSFGMSDTNATLPTCTQSSIPENIDIEVSLHYQEISCQEADSVDITQLENFVQASSNCTKLDGCDVDVLSRCHQANLLAQVRKTETLALVVKMSGLVTHTNYFVNGRYDNATAVVVFAEYTTLLTEFDSILVALYNATGTGDLDVTVNGKAVSPSLEANSHLACSPGKVDRYGVCANCPQGSQQHQSDCELCQTGFYQDREGQTYCMSCADGYTTQQVGSTTIEECVLDKNDLPQSPESENDLPQSPESVPVKLIVVLCVGGFLVGVITLTGFLFVKYRTKKTNRVDSTTSLNHVSPPSRVHQPETRVSI